MGLSVNGRGRFDRVAEVLGMAVEDIRVVHAEGAGCYGHNGADDVSFDAALLARAVPGRPVLLAWTRATSTGGSLTVPRWSCRWPATRPVDSGRGMGFGQYKNIQMYFAVVIELSVGRRRADRRSHHKRGV